MTPQGHDRPRSIVIVEDHPDVAMLLQYKLKKEGYDVVSRADGIAGLAEIREHRPDLVLLDLMLPRMSGFEVLHALKSDAATKDIPVIIVTALSQEQDVVRGLEGGASDYIVKPLRPAELVIRVNKVLGGGANRTLAGRQ